MRGSTENRQRASEAKGRAFKSHRAHHILSTFHGHSPGLRGYSRTLTDAKACQPCHGVRFPQFHR